MWQCMSNTGNFIYNFYVNRCYKVYRFLTGGFYGNQNRLCYEPINEEGSDKVEVARISERNIRDALKYKRIFYRFLTVGAVTLDTIFIVFLYHAMRSAIEYSLKKFDLNSEAVETPFLIISGGLVCVNLVSELLIVNPIEEAERMATTSIAGFIGELEGIDRCERITATSFSVFNQIIAQPCYVIGAATDAVSLAYLVSQTWLKWVYGVPVTFLGVVYYNMLTRVKINEHAQELIRKLLNCRESILVNTLRNPAKSLEILVQSLSNGMYRAVAVGYVMDQILVEILNQSEDNSSNIYYIASATFVTLYISLFSRTLNVRDKVLNPEFINISLDVLRQTHVSKIGSCIDVLMTILRVIPASVIIYRHGLKYRIANIMLSSSVGAVLLLQGLYVRYKTRLYQTALDNLKQARLESIHNACTITDIFDHIQEQKKTKGLKMTATVLNVCSRVSRSIAFLGFLSVLNDVLIYHGINLQLDFWDLLCLHQLWGNSTFENEISFFQSMIEENLAYYKTKLTMERNIPHFGVLCSFWKTKRNYPDDYLKKHLSLIESDDEHQEAQNNLV